MRKWICALTLITTFCGWCVDATMNEGDSSVYAEVTVLPQETLWSVASAHIDNNTDIRRYVYDIQKMNNIHDPGHIIPGQVLKLPYPNK